MGHSNNRITKDGGLCPKRDVSVVLGLPAPSGDWGYLCSNAHGRTNKWAKYKPEATGTHKDLTLDQRKANNFGLDLGSQMVTSNPLDETWRSQLVSYIPPGAGHWKRLGDFIGYNHNAQPPVSKPKDVALSQMATSVIFNVANMAIAQDEDLTLKDFSTLAEYYPCVVISGKRNNEDVWTYATAANKFSESTDTSITVSIDDLPAGISSFKVFLCGFSAKKTTFKETGKDGQFIILPADVKPEGTITKKNVTDFFGMTAKEVAAGTVVAGMTYLFQPITKYQLQPEYGAELQYLSVGTDGSVYVGFDVRATESSVTLHKNLFRWDVTNNLAGRTSGRTRFGVTEMFGLTDDATPKLTKADTLTIPGGSTKKLILKFSSAAYYSNSGDLVTSPSVKQSQMMLDLYYGETPERVGGAMINIQV